MFDQLRFKFGVTYTRFHFRKNRDQVIRFTEAVDRARRALVIFPEASPDAESLQAVLKYLLKRFTPTNIVVVTRRENLSPMLTHHKVPTVAYAPRDVNSFFVPRKELLRKLKSSTFDIAFDLNVSSALSSSFLCRASEAPLRVGFVKPYADYFYNFQIQTRARSNSSFAYRAFLNCLEMF